jgi:hypothetical protein
VFQKNLQALGLNKMCVVMVVEKKEVDPGFGEDIREWALYF